MAPLVLLSTATQTVIMRTQSFAQHCHGEVVEHQESLDLAGGHTDMASLRQPLASANDLHNVRGNPDEVMNERIIAQSHTDVVDQYAAVAPAFVANE